MKKGLWETRSAVTVGKEEGIVSRVFSVGRELEDRSSVWRCSKGGDRESSEVREQEEREIEVSEDRMR